jgi:hypothetical protein
MDAPMRGSLSVCTNLAFIMMEKARPSGRIDRYDAAHAEPSGHHLCRPRTVLSSAPSPSAFGGSSAATAL